MQQVKDFFRRRMALLLACVMVLSMLPVTAFAVETPTEESAETSAIPETAVPMSTTYTGENGVVYTLYDDHAEVTGYSGYNSEVVVLAEVEGLPVTVLRASAFSDGGGSFTSVVLPEGLTTIEESAFSWCSTLQSINIPEGVTTLEEYTFLQCDALTSIDLPDSLKTIGDTAFFDCDALTSIDLPDGLTAIGNSAFSGCDKLTSVVIPAAVTSIGEEAFFACSGLHTITVSPQNAVYSSADGILYRDAGTRLVCCPGARSGAVSIPAGVVTIEASAFSCCNGLTSVTIPAGVTSIGSEAFYNCDGLTSVTIPSGVTSIGRSVFAYCDGLTSMTIPDGVTAIEYGAFRFCTNLQSVVLPESVTSIGNSVFEGCTNLKTAELPENVTSIGGYAFYNCSNLKIDKIPEKVTSIGWYAFCNCDSLTIGVIPDSVTGVGQGAFANCDGLESVEWTKSDSSISWNTFAGCDNLKTLTIPTSVTRITYEATYGCNNLSDVYYDGTRAEWSQVSIGVRNTGIENATIHFNDGTTSNDPEPHDTLDSLTDLDYMAFSAIAYLDFGSNDGTIENCMKNMGYWDDIWHKDLNIKYSELCASIAGWEKVTEYDLGLYNGFYALAFVNDNGETVISYRGSVPPAKWFDGWCWDAYFDWFVNDLPIELGNSMGPQFKNALEIYNQMADDDDTSNVVVTGHSLGGAWADAVSAYSGCKGVSFNAVSILDVLYKHDPKLMGEVFSGVNQWNFVDHTNKNDILAGMFEHFWSTEMKPYVAHDGNIDIEENVLSDAMATLTATVLFGPTGAMIASNKLGFDLAADVAACHGMESLVTRDSKGRVVMTSVADTFVPSQKITNYMLTKNHSVDLGTSVSDTITEAMTLLVPRTSYGGNGDDEIYTSIQADTIIGGPDDTVDLLDGSWGDDTYIYWIGDGYDKIWDVSGQDTLKICGAGSGATIEAVINDATDMVDVYCNGELIVSLYSKNRAKLGNSFTAELDNGVKANLTAELVGRSYSSTMRIRCPVDVEVLDSEGIVVYTLRDGEVSTSYTDYGNFYVIKEEDGGYGKVLDLVEGYTARIVGAGEGTMDVTYQVPVDGELTDPVSVTEVPVTDSLVATIEEDEENNVYLVIDADGDGAADEQLLLEAEHVHEWDEGTVTKEATCTEAGEITYACSGCEETMTETVEAKGHAYEAVITDPTCTEQGYTTYTCAGCGDSYVSDYVDAGHRYTDGVCTGCGKVETIVAYTQASLSLAGDIGVNYYVKLSSDIVADEGAYMQFTVAGETQTIPVNEAEVNADGTYRFSCKVAAKQMTDLITGQIYLSDGTAVGAAKTYSVKAYCDAAIPFYSQNADCAELVALMKAMMNYGGYSQVQFGYNTDNLANAGLDLPLPVPTEEDVSFYANYAQGSEEGISVASASLLLESTTTIRFYFQLDGSRSIEAYTFCVDGEETAPVQVSENMYYVDKVNVAARDLDHMATVTVGGLTARYCGLSYVRQVAVLHADVYSENLVNVAKALYAYNQAANAYFE